MCSSPHPSPYHIATLPFLCAPRVGTRAPSQGALAGFRRPFAVAVSPDGTTALAVETNGYYVRAVDTTTGAVTTSVGSGSSGCCSGSNVGAAGSVEFGPYGVAITPDGSTMLLSDLEHNQILAVDLVLEA